MKGTRTVSGLPGTGLSMHIASNSVLAQTFVRICMWGMQKGTSLKRGR
jgi:hypothetical protein